MTKKVDDYIEPLLDAQKAVKQIEKAMLHKDHIKSLDEIRKAQIALEKIQRWLVIQSSNRHESLIAYNKEIIERAGCEALDNLKSNS